MANNCSMRRRRPSKNYSVLVDRVGRANVVEEGIIREIEVFEVGASQEGAHAS